MGIGWGDVGAVEFLIAGGDDVNARDNDKWTALHHATVGREHHDVVKLLIRAGADVNAKTGEMSNALLMSAAKGKVGEVIVLLDHGA